MSALQEFCREHGLPSGWKPKRLWPVVKDIIREHADTLADEQLRESYYMVRDYLAEALERGDIDAHEMNWFLTAQGYSSYCLDIWTQMEQKEGLTRPEAKPEGWFYDAFGKHPIEELGDAWDQTRGWVYVEKAGEADKIQDIAKFGWGVVVAGKGFPTRLVRSLLQESDRPVLVFHDADVTGGMISDTFGDGSRRTSHLGLEIERAENLGLAWDDVVALKLPTQPEPPKYNGEPRAEISALSVLKLRMGIEEPAMDYVMLKILQAGYLLAPLEVERQGLWRAQAEYEITRYIENIVTDIVSTLLDDEDEFPPFEGTAVSLNMDLDNVDVDIGEDDIRPALKQLYEDVTFVTARDVHELRRQKVNGKLAKALNITVKDCNGDRDEGAE